MRADVDLLPAIDTLYAAALDPSLWAGALSLVGEAVGARGALIVPTDPSRTAQTIASDTLDEANADYCQGWWRFDTRIAETKARGLRPGVLITDHAYSTSPARRSDPFYQEFLLRHSLGNCAAYTATDGAGGIVGISTHRDLRAGAYDACELERLGHLAPHIARAFTLTMALAGAGQHALDMGEALEQLRFGVIVLDQSGRAVHVSEVARLLLGDGLQIGPDHQPRAAVASERTKLDRIVASALPGGDRAQLGPILLRRPSGKQPLYVKTLPIRMLDGLPSKVGGLKGGALILVRDIFESNGSDVAVQLEQLGLTKAEAKLSAIIGAGRSTRDAADALTITEGTARSQLKSIFTKLGIARQSELAVIVSKIGLLVT